jgi:hypothetical protein
MHPLKALLELTVAIYFASFYPHLRNRILLVFQPELPDWCHADGL